MQKPDVVSDLIIEVFRLNGRLLSAGDRLVGDLGLTSARWQVLGAVALAAQAETVAGIARSMGLTRQAVQRIVNDLLADGLLAGADNPSHRTARLVSMTEAGAAAFAEASQRQRSWAERIAAGQAAPAIVEAAGLLRALRQNLEEDE
jgi:DNA-binding MarR family transcriptional regulator